MTTRERSPLRDRSHAPSPLSSPPAPKLINSEPTLPLAPILSNENTAAVSPGSGFLNKQTHRPVTVPALPLGPAGQGCALPPPAPSRPLRPTEPGCGALIQPRSLVTLSSAPPGLLPPFCAFGDFSLGPAWPENVLSSLQSPGWEGPPEGRGWAGVGSSPRARRPLPCTPLPGAPAPRG